MSEPYSIFIFDDTEPDSAPHSHWFDAGVPAMCDKCGRHYVMGLDGMVSGCDRCLKVKRDLAGHAWERAEMVHHYAEPDGTVTKVTRRQAFAFRNPRMRGRYDISAILDKQGYAPDYELVGGRWELA